MTSSAQTGDRVSEPGGASQAALALALTGATTRRPDLPLPADDRLVVIGQAPSRNHPDKPLFPYPKGCSGYRLAKLMGVSPWRFLRSTVRLNVFYEAPGELGYFPTAAARCCAREIAPHLDGRRVIFLGRGVAGAFGVTDLPLLEWRQTRLEGAQVAAAIVPHPSGGNRWYNDAANREAVETFLRALPEVQPISPPQDRSGA